MRDCCGAWMGDELPMISDLGFEATQVVGSWGSRRILILSDRNCDVWSF